MASDATGKVSFDHIYAQSDPRAYFSTLRKLHYCIPQLAKPYFLALSNQYRQAQQVRQLTILDVGCSYGINAALMKCEATMDELSERYDGRAAGSGTRESMLARDRRWTRARDRPTCARFVGLDSSLPALSYALAAGFIDDAVHADLEERELTGPERRRLASTGLVISTGCVGYIGARTIAQLASAGERRPWMAHFVLRMFPFEPLAECLAEMGYETVRSEGLFKQRRFASAQEQARVLDALSSAGVDPRGLEADGWLYTQLHVSRPREPGSRAVVDLPGS